MSSSSVIHTEVFYKLERKFLNGIHVDIDPKLPTNLIDFVRGPCANGNVSYHFLRKVFYCSERVLVVMYRATSHVKVCYCSEMC